MTDWYMSYSTGMLEEDVYFDMDRFDDRDVGLVDDFFDHDDDGEDEIDFLDY